MAAEVIKPARSECPEYLTAFNPAADGGKDG